MNINVLNQSAVGNMFHQIHCGNLFLRNTILPTITAAPSAPSAEDSLGLGNESSPGQTCAIFRVLFSLQVHQGADGDRATTRSPDGRLGEDTSGGEAPGKILNVSSVRSPGF